MKQIKVFVDPNVGLKGNNYDCPVCRGLKKAFRTDEVEIHAASVAYIDGLVYFLPELVTKFIMRHDRGQGVVDFSFTLENKYHVDV